MNKSPQRRESNLIKKSHSLIGPSDPPAFEIFNESRSSKLLLVCDHASTNVPKKLKNLGIDKSQFKRHIAYDIGAAEVTRKLAYKLNSTAIVSGYSRLVIDLNRPPGDFESIPEISDNISIPENQGLTDSDKSLRISSFFKPYHDAIKKTLIKLSDNDKQPVLFSIHSFSPNYGDKPRPWDIGVLWNRDPRIALPLIEKLNQYGLNVGDNLPYSGLDLAYTIDLHGTAAGIANCVVEINQSQVQNKVGIMRWVNVLSKVLEEILKMDSLYQHRQY
ncbi:MAG: N-formylglutamate amidohydrolase [Pseudomonadota bacterium]|nr:N-formylglutamate amidohydrolase [Pseudomonadota bacterium]